jgi:protein gp37
MMGDKSKIEWTDATWNPVTGCTKVSTGCKFCYAERDFHRPYPGRAFTDVRTHPERLDQPLRWKRPRKIFVNSMSDLFHEKAPQAFLDRIFAVMALSHQHVFQVLTKRPARMLAYLSHENGIASEETGRVQWWSAVAKRMEQEGEKFCVTSGGYHGSFEFPLSNVWLGVSVENQPTADERIPLLLQTPAPVHFVSYEPALAPVDFIPYLDPSCSAFNRLEGARLDWLIAGGESGRQARLSHPDWFRSARDQCLAAHIPFFFKQWGEWAPQSICAGPLSLCRWVFADGTWSDETEDLTAARMARLGKKRAGRLLDGREWNEFPQAP